MQLLNELIGFFETKVSLIKNMFKLALLETKLAKQNIYPLLICLSLLIPLILTLWISLLLVLGYLLRPYIENTLVILLLELAIQGGILLVVYRKILSLIKEMSFARTRLFLNNQQESE
ncbi:MAG: hypothetical protein H0U73_08570 [Tatlockia sp.]|nr:hypothetical protein [Tatlockia sp.]